MTLKPKPPHVEWKIYAKSGPVEIWEGRPRFGCYSQWECRNAASGETRPVEQHSALLTFNEMLTQLEP